MKGDNLRKNESGYSDPTAYQAIMNVYADTARCVIWRASKWTDELFSSTRKLEKFGVN